MGLVLNHPSPDPKPITVFWFQLKRDRKVVGLFQWCLWDFGSYLICRIFWIFQAICPFWWKIGLIWALTPKGIRPSWLQDSGLCHIELNIYYSIFSVRYLLASGMEEDTTGQQINEAVKEDEIDEKSIRIVQVLSWLAEKFDHKSETMKDESNDEGCPKLKNISLVLSHGGHFPSGTLAMNICLDLVDKPDHIKSHQGHRNLRLQN